MSTVTPGSAAVVVKLLAPLKSSMGRSVVATVSESFRCFVAIELADVDAGHRGVARNVAAEQLVVDQPASDDRHQDRRHGEKSVTHRDLTLLRPRSRTVSGWVTRCRAIRRESTSTQPMSRSEASTLA